MYKKMNSLSDPTCKKPDDSVHSCRSAKKDSSMRYSDYKRLFYLHLLSVMFLLLITLISYALILGSFFSMDNKDLGKMQDKIYLNPQYPGILLMGHFPGNNSVLAQKISEAFPKEDGNDTDKGKRQLFHFHSNTVKKMNNKENAEQNVEFGEATILSDIDDGEENDYVTQIAEQENGGDIQMVENLLKNIFGLRNVVSGGQDGHYVINVIGKDGNNTEKVKRQLLYFDSNTVSNMSYKENAEQNAKFGGTTIPYDVDDDEDDYVTQIAEQENGSNVGDIQMVENLLKNIFGLRSVVSGRQDGQLFHFDSNTVKNMSYKENAEQNVDFGGTTVPLDVDDDDDDYVTQIPEQENLPDIQMVGNLLKNVIGLRNVISGGQEGHYVINNVIDGDEHQAGGYEPSLTENKAADTLLDGITDMQSKSQANNFLKALLLNRAVQKDVKILHHDHHKVNEERISTENYESKF